MTMMKTTGWLGVFLLSGSDGSEISFRRGWCVCHGFSFYWFHNLLLSLLPDMFGADCSVQITPFISVHFFPLKPMPYAFFVSLTFSPHWRKKCADSFIPSDSKTSPSWSEHTSSLMSRISCTSFWRSCWDIIAAALGSIHASYFVPLYCTRGSHHFPCYYGRYQNS